MNCDSSAVRPLCETTFSELPQKRTKQTWKGRGQKHYRLWKTITNLFKTDQLSIARGKGTIMQDEGDESADRRLLCVREMSTNQEMDTNKRVERCRQLISQRKQIKVVFKFLKYEKYFRNVAPPELENVCLEGSSSTNRRLIFGKQKSVLVLSRRKQGQTGKQHQFGEINQSINL